MPAVPEIPAIRRSNFITYCMGFYGPGGIYAMGATRALLSQALDAYLLSGADFAADSADREAVRDILIRDHGLLFPDAPTLVKARAFAEERRAALDI